MFLKEVKRKNEGKIKDLWQIVRILKCVLKKYRDTMFGEHILPMCMLLSNMFGFKVAKKNYRYYVSLQDGFCGWKLYDPELLIECSITAKKDRYGQERQVNDMDYAWIYRECFEWAVLEVGDLLKNVETKNKYDDEVNPKKFTKNKKRKPLMV